MLIYITTCNNEAYTLLPPSKHPFKKPFSGTKTIRTHPINIPVTTELKIYYPFAGPKTPTAKCSNQFSLSNLDWADRPSSSTKCFTSITSIRRVWCSTSVAHAVFYPGSDIVWNVFRRCYAFVTLLLQHRCVQWGSQFVHGRSEC